MHNTLNTVLRNFAVKQTKNYLCDFSSTIGYNDYEENKDVINGNKFEDKMDNGNGKVGNGENGYGDNGNGDNNGEIKNGDDRGDNNKDDENGDVGNGDNDNDDDNGENENCDDKGENENCNDNCDVKGTSTVMLTPPLD